MAAPLRLGSSIQWSAYPAGLVAGCLALGIVAAEAWAALGVGAWLALAAGAAALAGAAWWHGRHRLVALTSLGLLVAAGLATVALGGLRHHAARQRPAHHVARVLQAAGGADLEVTLSGVVRGAPDRSRRATRLTLAADSLALASGPRGAARMLGVTGRVRVGLLPSRFDSTGPFPVVREGDRLRIRGTLRVPTGRRNPADFDYAAYLRRRGVHATLNVYTPEAVAVAAGTEAGPLTRVVVQARGYVEDRLAAHVPDAEARAVLRALLLGDRHQIARTTRDAFAATGLMHLLAVSGLHVLLVGFVVYGLMRPSLLRTGLGWRPTEAVRGGLTLAVLATYALVTGGSASVVRAGVMGALLIGGHLFQRSAHPLNTLGVAALVLLGARPAALFDVGFQLSFAAVAAIVSLNPVLQRAVPQAVGRTRAGRWVASMTTVSLAATLGTAPVLLVHFGYVSAAGLVLNLVAIPCTSVALGGGLLAVLAGGAVPALGTAFGATATASVRLLVWTAEAGAEVFSAWSWQGAVTDPWLVAAMAAALVALAQVPRPRHRWRLASLTLLLMVASVGAGFVRGEHRPRLDVLFFDVGQGDAALLTMPNGRTLLMDAGPRSPFTDAGARVVLPHLRRLGLRRLDAVVITHADSDHLGGLPSLLRAVEVGRVLHNGWPADTRLYAETMHLLDSLAVPHRAATAGDTLALDPTVALQILGPPPEAQAHGFGENDASVVVRAVHGATRWLFAGDVEAAAEGWLAQHTSALLASDVVKVPHHGSTTSSTPAFVDAVTREAGASDGRTNGAMDGGADDADAPVHAVVSVGRRNAFGLPSRAVLARWRAEGARLHSTAEVGAVWLRSDGARVESVAWRTR